MNICQDKSLQIYLKIDIKLFFLLFFVFILAFFPFLVNALCQPYGECSDTWVCCPGGTPAFHCQDSPYTIIEAGYGASLGAKGINLYTNCTDCYCSLNVCKGSETNETRWGICSDGTKIVLNDCFVQTCPLENCGTNKYCWCGIFFEGYCVDGGQTPMCQIQNLTCPATCTIGQNFNVSYEYRNTSYATKPYFSQRIEGSNPWGSYTQLWCLADQTVNDDQWHTVTQSIACSNNFTGTIRVGAHSNAGHWIDWCDYGWENAQIGCSASCSVQPVQPIPPAIGYVNIKHPLGILKLRLISFANALSALKGIIKVARFAGDTNAAADLVEPTDPNASPVRVMTPYGIKAWRREP